VWKYDRKILINYPSQDGFTGNSIWTISKIKKANFGL
jgi:hypothetical protein